MRQITKGGSPAVLTGEGARFQQAALEFALTGATASTYGSSLAKHRDPKSLAQPFNHYASALFAEHSFYSDPTVKRQLIITHAGKCAFCESFIMDTDVGDVEHYRPKAAVTMATRDEPERDTPLPDHPGYFWLAASWDNLFLSCKQCNQAYKRNLFEVFGDRATPAAPGTAETPLLLNPAMADADLRRLIRFDPATALAMRDPSAFGHAFDPRVEPLQIDRTIAIVGLNRPRLVQARANHLVKLRALFSLVVTGADLPWDAPLPHIRDTYPGILRFVAPADSVAADALDALKAAVAPAAEFSALSMDALIVWSTQLAFNAPSPFVAQQFSNLLRVQAVPPRLNESVALAARLLSDNAGSNAAEAAPDTSDLDPLYNTLLARYKAITLAMKKDEATLTANRLQASQLSEQRRQQDRGNGVTAFEDRLAELEGFLNPHPGEPPRDPTQIELARQEYAHMQQAALQQPLQSQLQQSHALLTQIEMLEEVLDDYWGRLNDISAELVDIAEAYSRRGVPRAERRVRCEALRAGVDELISWLQDGSVLSETTLHHLNGSKYPPAIRS